MNKNSDTDRQDIYCQERFYIITFGCQMNENDSLRLSDLFIRMGHIPAESPEAATVLVINTCCVRESAEHKVYSYIGRTKRLAENNPDFLVAVCGCLAQSQPETLARAATYIGAIAGNGCIHKLPEMIEKSRQTGEQIICTADIDNNPAEDFDDFIDIRLTPRTYGLSFRASVNIMYGCDNYCSYCIVPYVRGREKSRKPEDILVEINQLVEKGVKEILLLGQNVNSYGRILPEWGFARLLDEAAKTPGIERIRYMTSHPRDFTGAILDSILKHPNICRHFHLPAQSGCDRLLSEMNRGYTAQYYINLLSEIRSVFPDATITSDLIVGYPGETETDFAETLDFVKTCQFDSAFTFIYSKRSGTPAAKADNQILKEIKQDRLSRLMQIQNAITLSKNQRLLGKTLACLVEGRSKKNDSSYTSRTDGNKIVVFPADAMGKELLPGSMAKVKITAANTWSLSGLLA